MVLTCKEEVFDNIISYVKKRLGPPYTRDMGNEQFVVRDVVTGSDIQRLEEICIYENWLSEQVNSKKSKKKEKPVVSAEVERTFNTLWEAFPTRSQFDYKGKHYPGDRVLRKNKNVCLKLYNSIVTQDAAAEPVLAKMEVLMYSNLILKALQVQLQHIRMESERTGQNKMQYLNGLEVWLRQRTYEGWLGQEIPIEEEKVSQYTEA